MTQMTLQQALTAGIKHQQNGRYAEAEGIYRQILEAQPNNPDALHLLGLLASQVGQYQTAVDLIRQAISFAPQSYTYYSNLGSAYLSWGRTDDAIKALRTALALQPNYPEAASNLGTALQTQGKFEEAIRLFKEVIAQRPTFAEAYNNLGNALRANGQYSQAIDALQKAISLKPEYSSAYNGLGSALRAAGMNKEAISTFRKALSLRPNYPEALNNLGNALHAEGDLANAIITLRKAAEIGPGSAEVRNNLGSVLKDSGALQEAIKYFDEALTLVPDFGDAHNNRASACQAMGRLDEAIAGFRRAIECRAGDEVAHVNLGITLLLKGQFSEGWKEYEHRWNDKQRAADIRRLIKPRWNGQPIKKQRLLLHAEQGFGDTIQFIRYLPWVAEQSGAKIIVQCQKQLVQLLGQIPGIDKIVDQNTRLPDFDLHCPLLSLPAIFNTTVDTIPKPAGPYIRADKKLSKKWQSAMDQGDRRKKIGLCWAGQNHHLNDRNRSMHFKSLAPLRELTNAHFFSLQKGEPADQAADADSMGIPLTDWSHKLTDFSETAALIDNLDLVITVDTSVAHLAGAMGKPTFLLLPFVPDWRWLLDRNDSPWYPSMTIYRQPKIGDWESPIRQIVQRLNNGG